MSNVMVKGLFQPEWFSEFCGLFSSFLPSAFFLDDGVVERGKGDGCPGSYLKKNTISQNNLLLLLKNSNISASLSGPAVQDHRVVLWWQPVFCIRCDGLSFNIHQLWASLS